MAHLLPQSIKVPAGTVCPPPPQWRLPDDSSFLDVIKQVAVDETNHRDVNHTFASMAHNEVNPYVEKVRSPRPPSSPPAAFAASPPRLLASFPLRRPQLKCGPTLRLVLST